MTNIEQIVMKKTGINEEQLKKLEQVLQEEENFSGYEKDIEISVKNGIGTYDYEIPTKFPIPPISVNGVITSPCEGNWQITIKKDKDTIFNEKGIKCDQKKSLTFSKGIGKVTIHATADWSENKDTILKVHLYT